MTRAEELADRPGTRIENLRDQIVGSFDPDLAAHGRRHLDQLVADAEALAEALEAEVKRVCECDGEDTGSGPGVGVIDCERSSFDYGADSHDGAGNVITDYFDCPCAPLRAALARHRGEK